MTSVEKMKINMSTLKNKYRYRTAAVLGGGPSLPSDIAKLPAGCLLIAVNYHAFYYCEPEFMVYNDTPETNPLQLKAVQETAPFMLALNPPVMWSST